MEGLYPWVEERLHAWNLALAAQLQRHAGRHAMRERECERGDDVQQPLADGDEALLAVGGSGAN
jgi:hypothetical protein